LLDSLIYYYIITKLLQQFSSVMTDSLAQQEADKFFSNKDRVATHPEDASDPDNHSDVEEKDTTAHPYHSDPGDDDDTLHSMAATTTATYHVPHTLFDANTGPKGVIADAQAFNRAKKSSLRNAIQNITNGSYFQPSSKPRQPTPPRTGTDSAEKSGSGHEEEDEEFMHQWRQSRLRELSGGASQRQRRRQSPSKRKWGFFKEVDASEYLDAVEKTSSETVVVVCIFDPEVGSAPSWPKLMFTADVESNHSRKIVLRLRARYTPLPKNTPPPDSSSYITRSPRWKMLVHQPSSPIKTGMSLRPCRTARPWAWKQRCEGQPARLLTSLIFC
jgi:hypothetical protein